MVVKCLYGKDFPFEDGDLVYGSGFETSCNYRPTKFIAAKQGVLFNDCTWFMLVDKNGKKIRKVRTHGMWFSLNREEALKKYNEMVQDVIDEMDEARENLFNNYLVKETDT